MRDENRATLLPLPRRTAPHSWEDLASVISRTARKMGYKDPKWILQPENHSYYLDATALPLLHKNEDFQVLEQLLLLNKETIHSLTLHRFAPLFPSRTLLRASFQEETNSQDSLLFLEDISPFSHLRHTIRVCPHCLDEPDAYDRLYWRVKALLFCPRHRILLINSCPNCHAPIPALRPHVSLCPSCKRGNYRMNGVSVPDEEAWLTSSLKWTHMSTH